MNEVAYSPDVPDNPNFVSRPPDPGAFSLYKTMGFDALYHSPVSGVYRSTQLMLEQNPYFNVDGKELSVDEANSQYGLNGQLKFDEPIKESAAQLMVRRKIAENDRNYVIGSGMTTGFRQAAGIGVGMAATLLDPVNTASMFIPVVGEARFARMVQRFGGSVMKARLAAGAIEGAVGMAMVEPFVLLPAMQEQANYDITDSATNLMYGAGLGAFLHAGFGAIGDHMKRLKPREADAIFEAAMNNVLRDEPVTHPARVADFVEPVETIDPKASTPDLTGAHLTAEEPSYGATPRIEQTLDQIPRRDAKGRFLSKEARLQLLQEKINSDRIRTESQGQKVDIDTQKDTPRLTSNDLSDASVHDKVYSEVTKEADDLEKQILGRQRIPKSERGSMLIPGDTAKEWFNKQIQGRKFIHEGKKPPAPDKIDKTKPFYTSIDERGFLNEGPSRTYTVKQLGNIFPDPEQVIAMLDKVPKDVQIILDKINQAGENISIDTLVKHGLPIDRIYELARDLKEVPPGMWMVSIDKPDTLKTQLDEDAIEAATKLHTLIKEQIGDPVKREAGVNTAVECIIKNLI
jgi:hypothetical protein